MNDRNKLTVATRLATWWQAIRDSGIADSMSEADLSTMAQAVRRGLLTQRNRHRMIFVA